MKVTQFIRPPTFMAFCLIPLLASCGPGDNAESPNTESKEDMSMDMTQPDKFEDGEQWEPIGDETAAPETEKNTHSDSFSTGTFDETPFVPSFELADKNTLVARPNVRPLEQGEAMMADVSPDKITFPMGMMETAQEWEPGKLIVSAGGGPKNPFGFARRVKSVTEQNGEVVVETERAELSDIIDGDLVLTLDPDEMQPIDMDQLDPEWARENLGYDPIPDEPPSFGWSTYVFTYDAEQEPIWGFVSSIASAASSAVSAVAQVVEEVVEVIEEIIPSWTISSPTWHGFDTGKFSFKVAIPKKQLKPIQPRKGGKMQVYVEGEIEPSFDLQFDPGLQLDMTISSVPNLSKFTVNMDSRVDAELGLKVKVDLGIESWDGEKGEELSKKLQLATTGTETALNALAAAVRSDPDFTPGAEWKRTIWKSKPFVKAFLVGVVPVAVVGRFRFEAGCTFAAKGSMVFDSSAKIQVNSKFSVEHYPLAPLAAPVPRDLAFSSSATGDWNITGGAEAQFECFVLPVAEVSVYDAISIELGPRVSPFVAQVKAEGSCPNTFHPTSFTPQTDASVELFGAVTAQASFKVTPPGVEAPGIEVGPMMLWQKKESYWGPKEMSFDTGLGYCTPQCEDGEKNGNETDVDCGGDACERCGTQKVCKVNSDCAQNICNNGTCLQDPCLNGVRDNNETGVDCGGGTCGGCELADQCLRDTDCISGHCSTDYVCVESSCVDGKLTDGECGLDCGDVCGTSCSDGATCADATQCASGWSNGFACVSTHCRDLGQDADETDVDCGGDTCVGCASGLNCNDGADCYSGYCSVDSKCVENNCLDGRVSEDESDLDCGGTYCTPCDDGRACTKGSDCVSGHCSVDNVCVASACLDGRTNESETDIDCGGFCPDRCMGGQTCGEDADCVTGTLCINGSCSSTLCNNNVKDSGESDVDCGAVCANKCTEGQSCVLAEDCDAGLSCINNVCEDASCFNTMKDNDETDVDCGGSCDQKCAVGAGCTQSSDCEAGICNASNVCEASLCQDLTQNQDETDVDCGGSNCPGCGVGQSCTLDSDCASNDCECGDSSGQCAGNSGTCGAGKILVDQPVTDGTSTSATYTIPAGCTAMYVQAWGAAGGSENFGMGTVGQAGGAGGFVSGTIAVTPGDTVNIWLGQGGGTDTFDQAAGSFYGVSAFGGNGDDDLFSGGGGEGGGLTSVQITGASPVSFSVPGGGGSSSFVTGEAATSTGGGGAAGNEGASAGFGSSEPGGGAGEPGGSTGMAGAYGTLPMGLTAGDGFDDMPEGTSHTDYGNCLGANNGMPGAGAGDSFSFLGIGGDGCVVLRCVAP